MDFTLFFEEPIKEIIELSPGYDDHASDVWLVKTNNQEVIVRTSRMIEEPSNDFWWGCKRIFGIDPRNVFELSNVHNKLSQITTIPIPKVLNKRKILSKEYLVVEKLSGVVVHSFVDQPPSVLQSLGEGLAKIHSYKENYIGSPSGNIKIKLEQFHQFLIIAMDELISKFYSEHEQIKEKYVEVINIISNLPSPEVATFILIDLDPTQFLSNGKEITGLVDTEAYVIGPREFDFIGLEYILDEKSARDFKIGYERIMEIPDLTKHRLPYRYLYRLLSVQGSVDINEWLNHKILF